MTREELAAWLQLVQADGIGPDSARRLLAAFGLPEQVLAQSRPALEQVVSSRQAEALRNPAPETLALIDTTWAWLQQDDGLQRRLLTLGSPDYPSSLLQMADPPVLLYGLGQVDRLAASQGMAMVGSRNPTPQGAINARQFARAFADLGWTVVSGLALGVDAAARLYFGVPARRLTVGQAAVLAGLPKAPSRFNPRVNPSAAVGRAVTQEAHRRSRQMVGRRRTFHEIEGHRHEPKLA